MAVILTTIESEIKTLIEGMTDSTYNYTWGTVNDPDMAKQTLPSAEIMLVFETNVDDAGGTWAQAYSNEAEFQIKVITETSEENEIPVYAINPEYNKALDDLKRLFGNNYNLNGNCCSIMYRSAERVNSTAGDIYRPGYLDTRWFVRYQQDRLDPEQVVP